MSTTIPPLDSEAQHDHAVPHGIVANERDAAHVLRVWPAVHRGHGSAKPVAASRSHMLWRVCPRPQDATAARAARPLCASQE
jgi:hypothetical protein